MCFQQREFYFDAPHKVYAAFLRASHICIGHGMLKWFSSVGLLIIHHLLFPYYRFTTPSLPTCIPYIGTPRSGGSFGSFRCLSNDWIHRPAVLPCLYAPLEPHSLPQPGWTGFLPLNVSKWLVTGVRIKTMWCHKLQLENPLLPRSVDINIRRARRLYTLPTEIIYPSTLSVITLNLWYHE